MPSTERTPATTQPESETSLQYVYGITWASAAGGRRPLGVAGREVRAVIHRDLAALVSPVASASLRARRSDLNRHAEVLAGAFARDTVLPLRFGAVFESPDAVVQELLVPRHDALARLLQQFDGLAELRVSAFYREESVLREIVEGDRQVARLRATTQTRSPAATYGLRLELGELVAGRLAASAERDRHRLLAELRPLAVDIVVDEQLTELQVLRASFLVERTVIDRFDRTLEEFAKREQERMQLKYVGPLPPHSFVSLENEGGRG